VGFVLGGGGNCGGFSFRIWEYFFFLKNPHWVQGPSMFFVVGEGGGGGGGGG